MRSRTTNTRIAALTTVLVAGVLAACSAAALDSSPDTATKVQQAAAEVRTQVIRRTSTWCATNGLPRPLRPRQTAGGARLHSRHPSA